MLELDLDVHASRKVEALERDDRNGGGLEEDEQAEYDASRAEYLTFYRSTGISLSDPSGWAKFIIRAHQSDEGRSAYRAFRRQKGIALRSRGKLAALWDVLVRHRADRVLVFTEDNETVYTLSERFLLPVITHQTRPPERRALLDRGGGLETRVHADRLERGVEADDAAGADPTIERHLDENRNARGVADREYGFDLKRPEQTGKRTRHARHRRQYRRQDRRRSGKARI